MASYLKFTTEYEDDTTRDLTIGEIDSNKINTTQLKSKIINFNTPATRASLYPNFDSAFLSESGANFKRIKAAEIITTTRTYYDVTN